MEGRISLEKQDTQSHFFPAIINRDLLRRFQILIGDDDSLLLHLRNILMIFRRIHLCAALCFPRLNGMEEILVGLGNLRHFIRQRIGIVTGFKRTHTLPNFGRDEID